jgi:beta-1,4-mannosyl-glycoprotein beta-1,4-N-acetylglucosaminyltransferase
MIVDCFTFFNEFEVLELRLRTLENVVDRFVLCEAPFTFRGESKPLFFAQAAERFARWGDRITYLTYTGPPQENPWENEWGQRDFLATALSGCAADDLILIGDCDEIPDPQLAARRPTEHRIVGHRMMLLAGYVNRVVGVGFTWTGTRALTVESLAGYDGLSDVRKRPHSELDVVDGGWHFTALGGAVVMERKMRAYSHLERDIAYFRDRRRLEVEYNWGDDSWLPLDDRFPRPLVEDRRWDEFILNRPPSIGEAEAQRLQHAHGCFAYVPPDPQAVAVVAADTGTWNAVGRSRFGAAFAGVFSSAESLPPLARGSCVVIDGLQRQQRGARGSRKPTSTSWRFPRMLDRMRYSSAFLTVRRRSPPDARSAAPNSKPKSTRPRIGSRASIASSPRRFRYRTRIPAATACCSAISGFPRSRATRCSTFWPTRFSSRSCPPAGARLRPFSV